MMRGVRSWVLVQCLLCAGVVCYGELGVLSSCSVGKWMIHMVWASCGIHCVWFL